VFREGAITNNYYHLNMMFIFVSILQTKEEGKALLREMSRRESTKTGIRNDPESASAGPYSISGCSTPVLRQVTMNLFASQIDKE